MKKLVAAITVSLYLILTCGVIVNLHYCMGHYQSFNLYTVEKKDCSKCGMPKDKSHGCCKDEVKIVKLLDDQNISTVSFSVKNVEAPSMMPSEFMAASFVIPDHVQTQKNYIPPDLSDQEVYLQNCVFRI